MTDLPEEEEENSFLNVINSDEEFNERKSSNYLMNHVLELETEIASLKRQLSLERENFEKYASHISKLNETREELIVEYETKEKELMDEIMSLKQQLNCYRNSETRDMLINQGMQDICMAPPGQQVAYLLIERARLMDAIEEMKQHYSVLNRNNLNSNKFLNNQSGGYDSGFVSGSRSEDHHPNQIHHDANSWSMSNFTDLLTKVESLEINNKLLEDKLKEISPQDFEDLVVSGLYKVKVNNNDGDDDDGGGGGHLTADKNKKKNHPPPTTPTSTMFFQKPKSLVEAIERLKLAEVKCHRVKQLEGDLRLKKVEIDALNVQLSELRQQQTTATQDDGMVSRDEQQQQLQQQQQDMVFKHGEKIETMLKSVEEHLKNIKSTSEHKKSDEENENIPMMTKQLKVLQEEFEMLKEELVKMIGKYDSQANKYREHKLACKNKLFKIRDSARREKEELLEKIEDLENKLILMKENIDGELIYKSDLEKTVKNLLAEQQSFVNQISQRDDTIHLQKVEINSLQTNFNLMQQEIKTLTQKLSTTKDINKKYVFDHSSNDQGSTVIISTIPTSGEKR